MTATIDASPSRRASRRRTVALRAATAQTVAFAAAALTVFAAADVAAAFPDASVPLWPVAACGLGLAAVANSTQRSGDASGAGRTGTIALAALAFTTAALALAPGYWFAVAAAGALGAAAGAVIAVAGRVLAAAEVGDGSASLGLSAAALLAGAALAACALAWLDWRGALGAMAGPGALAAWRFAAFVPVRGRVLANCDVRSD